MVVMGANMKYQFLIVAVLVGLFSVAHADSACVAGSLQSVIGTSCTIGNTDFSFETLEIGNADPASLTFTPESTSTSAGFNISGLADITTSGENYFEVPVNAVPLSGTFLSYTTTLNGVHQNVGSGFSSYASFSALGEAIDGYRTWNYSGPTTTNEITVAGGAASSLNAWVGVFNDTDNTNGDGYSGFQSADFVFNESDPGPTSMPEGSELAFMGLGTVAILGAMKKKFLVAR
jgi:hypothetical protein